MKRASHIQTSTGYKDGSPVWEIPCHPRRTNAGTLVASIARPERATCKRCLRWMERLMQKGLQELSK